MKTKKNAKKNVIKQVQNGEEIVSKYNGASVRKWASVCRDMKITLPKLYYYCASLPVRENGTGKVIVEGRYRIGCYWKGAPIDFARFLAQTGYKLPCSGTLERCKELVEEYKQALNQTGKYTPKAKKGNK